MFRGKVVALSLLAVSLSGVNLSAHADTKNTVMTEELAQTVVSEYKALRSECAEAKGQVRKDCYAALNSANQKYVLAKRLLSATDKSKDNDSVHYVSLAN